MVENACSVHGFRSNSDTLNRYMDDACAIVKCGLLGMNHSMQYQYYTYFNYIYSR